MANIIFNATNDLSRVLDPTLAAGPRALFSKLRKPWTQGYYASVWANGASKLVGVQRPADNDTTKRVVIQGTGSATLTNTGTAYTMPTYTGVPTLPTDTSVVDASVYADAFLLAYAPGDRSNALLVPRIATSASLTGLSGPFWQITSGTAFNTCASGTVAGTTLADWAAGYVLEIVVPAAGDISTLFSSTGTGQAVVKLADFLVAGNTSATNTVFMERTYR